MCFCDELFQSSRMDWKSQACDEKWRRNIVVLQSKKGPVELETLMENMTTTQNSTSAGIGKHQTIFSMNWSPLENQDARLTVIAFPSRCSLLFFSNDVSYHDSTWYCQRCFGNTKLRTRCIPCCVIRIFNRTISPFTWIIGRVEDEAKCPISNSKTHIFAINVSVYILRSSSHAWNHDQIHQITHPYGRTWQRRCLPGKFKANIPTRTEILCSSKKRSSAFPRIRVEDETLKQMMWYM